MLRRFGQPIAGQRSHVFECAGFQAQGAADVLETLFQRAVVAGNRQAVGKGRLKRAAAGGDQHFAEKPCTHALAPRQTRAVFQHQRFIIQPGRAQRAPHGGFGILRAVAPARGLLAQSQIHAAGNHIVRLFIHIGQHSRQGLGLVGRQRGRLRRCAACACAIANFAAGCAPMVDKAAGGKIGRIEHVDKHFLPQAALGQPPAKRQHAAGIFRRHIRLQRGAGRRAGIGAEPVFLRHIGQRRVERHHHFAISIALGLGPHHFIGQHMRAGRRGKSLAGIVAKALGAARIRPHAAIEHQPAADFAYALIAQLLLHIEQIVLIQHRVAAAHPINVAGQRVAAHRRGGFPLREPAVIIAQRAQSGKRGDELHHRSRIHCSIGAVRHQHLPALHILHIHRHFIGAHAAEIQRKSGLGAQQHTAQHDSAQHDSIPSE